MSNSPNLLMKCFQTASDALGDAFESRSVPTSPYKSTSEYPNPSSIIERENLPNGVSGSVPTIRRDLKPTENDSVLRGTMGAYRNNNNVLCSSEINNRDKRVTDYEKQSEMRANEQTLGKSCNKSAFFDTQAASRLFSLASVERLIASQNFIGLPEKISIIDKDLHSRAANHKTSKLRSESEERPPGFKNTVNPDNQGRVPSRSRGPPSCRLVSVNNSAQNTYHDCQSPSRRKASSLNSPKVVQFNLAATTVKSIEEDYSSLHFDTNHKENMENAAQDAATKLATLWRGISTAKTAFLANNINSNNAGAPTNSADIQQDVRFHSSNFPTSPRSINNKYTGPQSSQKHEDNFPQQQSNTTIASSSGRQSPVQHQQHSQSASGQSNAFPNHDNSAGNDNSGMNGGSGGSVNRRTLESLAKFMQQGRASNPMSPQGADKSLGVESGQTLSNNSPRTANQQANSDNPSSVVSVNRSAEDRKSPQRKLFQREDARYSSDFSGGSPEPEIDTLSSLPFRSPIDTNESPKSDLLPRRQLSQSAVSSPASRSISPDSQSPKPGPAFNVQSRAGAIASSLFTRSPRFSQFRNFRSETVSVDSTLQDNQEAGQNQSVDSTTPLSSHRPSFSKSPSNSRLSNTSLAHLNSLPEENGGSAHLSPTPSEPRSDLDQAEPATPTATPKGRTAMMNARYLAKLLKKQNSEPNGELGAGTGASNISLTTTGNAGAPDDKGPGRFASNAVFCARCKNEVVKQNGEWVEKRPLEKSNSINQSATPAQEVKKPSTPGFFSSALSSVFSIADDRGGLPFVGSIHFTLSFDFNGQVLTVGVIEAKGLTAKDRGGTSDPYVKILLLPEKKRRQETRVIYKNLNPTWNENLTFTGVPLEKLQKRILQLMVLDYDKFSRDDPIGEVNIPMCELDFTQPINMWKDLNPIAKEKYKRGEILLSLCYNPVGGIMTVTVVRCKELKPMDISGTSDPYVKLYQHYQGKRVIKHKTQCRMQSLNPVFDETFSFTVPTTKLEETQIVVTVMDKDMIKWNEKIGSVVLGKRSGQKEMQHWQEMLKSRRTPVAMWHYLRADLD